MAQHAARLAAVESALAFAYAFIAQQPDRFQDATTAEAVDTLRALGVTDLEMALADELGGVAPYLVGV